MEQGAGGVLRLLPVRCWSCNQPTQAAWDSFCSGARLGRSQRELLDGLGLGSRYCCRRMLIAQPLALVAGQAEESAAASGASAAPPLHPPPPPPPDDAARKKARRAAPAAGRAKAAS